MKVCVLGSGSAGNCIFVSSGKNKTLIDLGLCATRVEKSLAVLGETCDDINILITHSHHDHTGGVESFCHRHPSAKVFCHADGADEIRRKIRSASDKIQTFYGDFYIDELTVSPFRVSHDVFCVGYSLLCNGRKVSIATDLGIIPESLVDGIADSDLVVIESNHDERLLMANPAYSPVLKRRILSSHGHLSNETCATVVEKLVKSGVRQFVLAHLSRENNYPELAYETTKDRLLLRGLVEGEHYTMEVASQDKMSALFEIL